MEDGRPSEPLGTRLKRSPACQVRRRENTAAVHKRARYVILIRHAALSQVGELEGRSRVGLGCRSPAKPCRELTSIVATIRSRRTAGQQSLEPRGGGDQRG